MLSENKLLVDEAIIIYQQCFVGRINKFGLNIGVTASVLAYLYIISKVPKASDFNKIHQDFKRLLHTSLASLN